MSIIDLANALIEWTQNHHPMSFARNALTPPFIQPTSPDDPQPNPADCPDCIHFVETAMTPDQEIQFVLDQVEKHLQAHPDNTLAILSPRNNRSFKFVDGLKNRNLPYVDSMLQSTNATRLSTGAIANILNYLADPKSSHKLSAAYRVWRRGERENEEKWKFHQKVSNIIRKVKRVEEYIWPASQDDWLSSFGDEQTDQLFVEELSAFRSVVQSWHSTVFLPIDQLILTISQNLFLDPAELALAHKLSSLMRQYSNSHPDWRLPEFTEELRSIAKNQRKYLGFSQDDSAFDPDRYPGQVVVSTMHKAKGLEWDAVFLTSMNNYNFPSGHEYDQYQPEKWFIKDDLNMEAESVSQLITILEDHPFDWYKPGEASLEARKEFIRERLRLFYVGITRARSWLMATWNTGRFSKNSPALPFQEMINFLEQKQ
jgi:DNA helicase-2/ATP-dependent DNA helicase PcrA